jgi:beta-glucanase (GH16 family)
LYSHRLKSWTFVLLALLAGASWQAHAAAQKSDRDNKTIAEDKETKAGKLWKLVWSDEFDGPDGSSPDPTKWSFQTGGSGYGNNELENYTGRQANAHIEKGNLVITALKEEFTGADGVPRHFTSARIQTKNQYQFQYGRVEARIKVPAGQGLWPAFWMMGADIDKVQWPQCGELDIMENIGKEPDKVHGTLHGPGYSGAEGLTAAYTLPGGAHFSDDFHRFAIEWEPGVTRFYVDDKLFETQSASSLPAGKQWAFDHPFFLLLNLAVGGYWPGDPNAETQFPATMLVDYVRVYKSVAPATQAAAQLPGREH